MRRTLVEPFHVVPATTEPQRRLLLLSYHFPPASTAGALRWQKLAHYAVKRGWHLDVVTLAPSDVEIPDPLRLEDLPGGTRVFGVRRQPLLLDRVEDRVWAAIKARRSGRHLDESVEARDAPKARPDSLGRAEMLGGIRSRDDLRRAYHAWRAMQQERRWATDATQLAAHIAGPAHALVLTCGPPHYVHVEGRRLARRLNLPLVVDLRDPWTLVERLPEGIASSVWLSIAERLEREVVGSASLVVMNTEPAAEALRKLYPDAESRIIAVMNGYDEEAVPESADRRRFIVAYAGTVYLDRRPDDLFRATARLVNDLHLTPEQFGIEFMGVIRGINGRSIEEIARHEGIAAYVKTRPPAPRSEALAFLARASVLVSLPQDSHMAIPSKVFEYLQFAAWTLALAEPHSATARALQASAADVITPGDVDAIYRVLRDRYTQFAAGARPSPAPTNGPLSRTVQARLLLDALEQRVGLAAAHPRPADPDVRATSARASGC